MRTLIRTAEHRAMTRLASTLPKGSEERRSILGVLARLAAIRFKPFTQQDWYGLAGAERFSDGTEPHIAYFENLRTVPFTNAEGQPDLEYNMGMIVVDSQGISVQYLNQEGRGITFATSRGIDNPEQALQVAQVVARAVEAGRLPQGMREVHDDRGSEY
jgi:hypothetical protein